jgi:hypothetical protein
MCSAPQKQNVLVLLPESNDDRLITNVHQASNGKILRENMQNQDFWR